MMVWRLLSFWDGLFSGAMLNFQGVCRFTRPLWKPWRFSSCLSFPFFKCITRKTKVDTKMIASDLQSWWVFSCFSPHVGMVWYIVLDAQCFVEFPLWHFSGCQNDPWFLRRHGCFGETKKELPTTDFGVSLTSGPETWWSGRESPPWN